MESPSHLKISTASAMALDLKQGRFYRGATNPCVNMLLTYDKGCYANCSYCGLASKRPGSYDKKSFIHVAWPTLALDTIIDRVNERPGRIKRVCLSMITNHRCVEDSLIVARAVTAGISQPLSILISPTIIKSDALRQYREAGVDMIGVAIDTATEELFNAHRGPGVGGPHKWDHYRRTLDDALAVFGADKVSVHLIVGLGETDRELVQAFQDVHDRGALIHLFSFFAEPDSVLQNRPQPPWERYLRLQLARYLIEENISRLENLGFDAAGAIIDWGLAGDRLREIVNGGRPFMTSGCPGRDGEVACNRPFGNCLPGPKQWNYPYPPNDEELALIRQGLGLE